MYKRSPMVCQGSPWWEEKRTAQTEDISSILAALRENNPEDADAAATALKVKIKRDPQNDDLASILAALRENNPEDADAASAFSSRSTKRQDDLEGILAALRENNPEDADAAAGLGA
ncbi:hypothetical protein BU24DRAFT_460970 [Aaosphaeria arxii CBS 175.79]|uniref:Uncharacterized protein n=1 Tax=Aaosphaeria arxii CBS 175.79 TaxID=1450172 RepID=A0A6A5XYF5_9PLEO|nr:uncharacterized protein BU24DRAFT_460970 [Aaosphaeria arxii CBS 175.79]KAF2017989.1 hypothetical protein BU24DRAFT_460970 [Aaosphaeria arxii CBS 175.79]